jgi:hypothetical protein
MSDQRPGLDYGDASKRIKRIVSNPGHPQAKANLINSIISQATVREGERAKSLLTQESLSFSGRGTKQVGYGLGKKLGTGRWRFENGKWKQL